MCELRFWGSNLQSQEFYQYAASVTGVDYNYYYSQRNPTLPMNGFENMGTGKVMGLRPPVSIQPPNRKSATARTKMLRRRRNRAHAVDKVGSGNSRTVKNAALRNDCSTRVRARSLRSGSSTTVRSAVPRNGNSVRGGVTCKGSSATLRGSISSGNSSTTVNRATIQGVTGSSTNPITCQAFAGLSSSGSSARCDMQQAEVFSRGHSITPRNTLLYGGSSSNSSLLSDLVTPRCVRIETSGIPGGATAKRRGRPRGTRNAVKPTDGVVRPLGRRRKQQSVLGREPSFASCRDRPATPFYRNNLRKPKQGRIDRRNTLARRRADREKIVASLVRLEKSISEKLYKLQSQTKYKPVGNRLVPPLTRARLRQIPDGQSLLMGPIPN